MLRAERERKVLQEIKAKKIVRVSDLCRMFGVVENTVRRDLKSLQKRGLIRRVHGGAVLVEMRGFDDFPFTDKVVKFKAEKEHIGLQASKLIREGETIALDAGTTTLEIAKQMPNLSSLTIVTNSIPIILALEEKTQLSVICPGGSLRWVSRSFLGIQAEEFLRSVHISKTFLSAGGVTLDKGIQNPNIAEIPFKKHLIESSTEVILVITHDKIGNPSFAQICPLETIDRIITHNTADKKYIEEIRKKGIDITLV